MILAKLWTGAMVYFVESYIENVSSSSCRTSFMNKNIINTIENKKRANHGSNPRPLGVGSSPIHYDIAITYDKL